MMIMMMMMMMMTVMSQDGHRKDVMMKQTHRGRMVITIAPAACSTLTCSVLAGLVAPRPRRQHPCAFLVVRAGWGQAPVRLDY